MAKEKKAKIEKSKKERTFHYEILGIIFLIITLITILRLGMVGKYSILVFHFLFGDWYFLFVGILGVLGIYYLLVHHKLEIKSVRILGIALVILSLLILSHFSMHNFIKKYDDNYLQFTVKLYIDYFKNGRETAMVGGGVIGTVFFYVIYYLFSEVGTIFVSILSLFIGVVFITKLTIRDFFSRIGRFFKYIYSKVKLFFQSFYRKVSSFDKEYQKKKESAIRSNVTKKQLDDIVFDDSSEREKTKKMEVLITNTLNDLNIIYHKMETIVTYHLIIILISSYQRINYETLQIALKKVMPEIFIMRYDNINQQIIIEINRAQPQNLSLYESMKINSQLFPYVIGVDDRHNNVIISQNLLVIGSRKGSYQTFIQALIINFSLKKIVKDDIILIDLLNSVEYFSKWELTYYNNVQIISELTHIADKILEQLNNQHLSSVDEYNRINEIKINKKIVFIVGMEKVFDDQEQFEALQYLLQISKVIGVHIVGCLTSDVHMNSSVISNFEYKLLLKNNFFISEKLLGFNHMEILTENIEGFLKYRDLTIRMAFLSITNNEKNVILNKKK